jgi:hypothetical protein
LNRAGSNLERLIQFNLIAMNDDADKSDDAPVSRSTQVDPKQLDEKVRSFKRWGGEGVFSKANTESVGPSPAAQSST